MIRREKQTRNRKKMKGKSHRTQTPLLEKESRRYDSGLNQFQFSSLRIKQSLLSISVFQILYLVCSVGQSVLRVKRLGMTAGFLPPNGHGAGKMKLKILKEKRSNYSSQ